VERHPVRHRRCETPVRSAAGEGSHTATPARRESCPAAGGYTGMSGRGRPARRGSTVMSKAARK
jgi:hypothetical protein